jgi:hypothetical protein
MSHPSVWIVGDWRHADFSAAVAWTKSRADCTQFDDPSAAADSRLSSPLAILLVQSRPAQFSVAEVESLHAAAPLARLAALVGPWCEGEMRSGQPWPGVARVPWGAWRSRLGFELGLEPGNSSATASLPRTATETERIEGLMRWLPSKKSGQGEAIVCTDRKDRFESVADALAQFGWQSTWHFERDALPADLMIFDGWNQVSDGSSPAGTRRLLLLDFPRPEDDAQSATMGIDAVIALPLLLTDLAIATDRPQNGLS